MADIPIKFYKSVVRSQKFNPSNPPDLEDPAPVVNPPGSIPTTLFKLLGDVTDSSFVGKNGFVPVVVDESVLTLQSLTTNVLSTPLTGYVVGANTAITSSNTILTAFEQVQGQINARVSGTIATGQVAFGTGVNAIGGDNGLVWDNVNKRLGIGTNTPAQNLHIIGNIQLSNNSIIGALGGETINIAKTSGGGVFSLIINALATHRGSININNSAGLTFTSTGGTGNGIYALQNTIFNFGKFGGGAVNPSFAFLTDDLYIHGGSGNVSINTTTDAGFRLDVNGTARISSTLRVDTINNLGTSATEVLVKSATGVVSKRTVAEFRSDLGDATYSRDKYRLFNDAIKTIGIQSSVTFGRLNGESSTFQMANTANTGWWWGDSAHTTAQGAMALTTEGDVTVARSIRVGAGESDTSKPISYNLDVQGSAFFSSAIVQGNLTLNSIASGTGDVLMLNGSNQVVKGSIGGGEPVESNSLTVKFDNYNGYIHGNLGALSGNILFDFTDEILGTTAFMLHNSSTAPTFPTEAKLISGTYVANIDNYIWFCITKKTTGRVVQVTIGKL